MRKLSKKVIDFLKNGTQAQRIYICEQSFLCFAVFYFRKYFFYPRAQFHDDFCDDCHKLTNGALTEAAWIVFRESAKTSFAKIFVIWCIVYRKKRYINFDSYDKGNAEAALFDIVVELQTNQRLIHDFGQLYYKKKEKDALREATIKRINNFVTENGVKVEAFSTQESTRGRIYQNIRPDLYVLDDIENFKTKDSYAVTNKIISHVDELKSGLSPSGSILYLGNYITEDGVIDYVMRSVNNNPRGVVRNIPVMDEHGTIAWPGKYVATDDDADRANEAIEDPLKLKVSLESKKRTLNAGGKKVFEAEMLNDPESSDDYVGDRAIIKQLMAKAEEPREDIAGLKVWRPYQANHRYGIGGDTSEGKGLDANALVAINFAITPKLVVATFESNQISPKLFAHELKRAGNHFGGCIVCPEINNTGHATVAELQDIYENIHVREVKSKKTKQKTNEYGIRMTTGVKYDIIFNFFEAVQSGELVVLDLALLKEMYHYKRRDLNALKMEEGMTKHFDKLIAAAIAWEMRKYAVVKPTEEKEPRRTWQEDSDYFQSEESSNSFIDPQDLAKM